MGSGEMWHTPFAPPPRRRRRGTTGGEDRERGLHVCRLLPHLRERRGHGCGHGGNVPGVSAALYGVQRASLTAPMT